MSDGVGEAYRRQIRIERSLPGVVYGALEDTAHHVRVTVRFDDERVQSVTGEAVRLPWTTCPRAADGLASLAGTTLTTSLRSLRALYEPSIHCTHFFDLAQLAVSHAASGRERRSYEALCFRDGTSNRAVLRRDGDVILEWTVADGRIIEPDDFAGVGLRQGFLEWCSEHLDDEAAEAAFVLRRAASMTGLPSIRMDDFAVAADSGLSAGVCFTAQPERIQIALRNVGSARNYGRSAQGMLEGFAAMNLDGGGRHVG